MSSSSSWSHEPFAKTVLCKGDGLCVDGQIVATRVHSMFLSGAAVKNIESMEENLPARYVVCEIDMTAAKKRVIRDNGLELDYKQNENRGKDHRSYVPVEELNADQLASAVSGGRQVALPAKFYIDGECNVHPTISNRFEMYVDASAAGAKALAVGQKVRFLTFGGSVFVERFESLSGAANVFGKNASGETAQLSDQWTKGIAAAAAKKAPEEECEGVDSEEWS
eukprot:TRINITY_DN8398_c0_g1_i1.p1 TRINITY_DN8398_c0_g1~~TRINITY_DN8398_c0_g1_i1.p1  ORF type:complete len:241 (+),score=42.17 TRINITY_DN8398_c0_g1_i1:52-723(+)